MNKNMFSTTTRFFVLPVAFFTSFTASSEELTSVNVIPTDRFQSFHFNNPDALRISLQTPDYKYHSCKFEPGTSPSENDLETCRILHFYNPLPKKENFNLPVMFWADDQTGEIGLPVGNIMKEAITYGSACSYSLLITENNGFRIRGNGNDRKLGIDGCNYKMNRFTPTLSPVVTILNDSAYEVYTDISLNDKPMEANGMENAERKLLRGGVKMFTGDNGEWKRNNVLKGDKIDISFDNIRCPTIPSLEDDVDFRITPERTCEISPPLRQGVNLGDGRYPSLEVDDAHNEGFRIVYKTPDSRDAEDYYLVVMKEDRSKFASWETIKSGVEAEYRAKVPRDWYPHGGKFIIGISKNINNPGSVEFIGDTVQVRTFYFD